MLKDLKITLKSVQNCATILSKTGTSLDRLQDMSRDLSRESFHFRKQMRRKNSSGIWLIIEDTLCEMSALLGRCISYYACACDNDNDDNNNSNNDI